MLTCMVLSVERTWLGAHTNASTNRLKLEAHGRVQGTQQQASQHHPELIS